MKPEQERYMEITEVYYFLLRLLDDNKASDGVKRRAIELCLEDRDFYRRVSRTQSEKWLSEKLNNKIHAIQSRRHCVLGIGSVAVLVSSILLGAAAVLSKKKPDSSTNTEDIVMNHTSYISPFSHESVKNHPIPSNFPNKPFHIDNMPGESLDDKMKSFICSRAELGDPTMQRMRKVLESPDWEIHFCSPQEAEKYILPHEVELPRDPSLVADASARIIKSADRKDGKPQDMCVVILSPDGLSEELGEHRLAGTLANEMTSAMVVFNNISPPTGPGTITLTDSTHYSVPNWVHQQIGMYVLQEAISSLADIVEEARVATNNPHYMLSEKEVWDSLHKNMKNGKFCSTDPENYARVYFGIGLKKAGLQEDIIFNPKHSAIMENEYQRGVEFAMKESNREKFSTVLRFLGIIEQRL